MHNEAAAIRFKRCEERENILLIIFAWMSAWFNGNKKKKIQQQHVHERDIYLADLSQEVSAEG